MSACKDCFLKDCESYRTDNKEKTSAAKKKCYQNKKEYYIEKVKTYRTDEKNKIKVRITKRNYETKYSGKLQ